MIKIQGPDPTKTGGFYYTLRSKIYRFMLACKDTAKKYPYSFVYIPSSIALLLTVCIWKTHQYNILTTLKPVDVKNITSDHIGKMVALTGVLHSNTPITSVDGTRECIAVEGNISFIFRAFRSFSQAKNRLLSFSRTAPNIELATTSPLTGNIERSSKSYVVVITDILKASRLPFSELPDTIFTFKRHFNSKLASSLLFHPFIHP